MVAAAEGATAASTAVGTTSVAWIIVLLPFVSFFLIVFAGKRTTGRGAWIGIAAMAASFVLSLVVLSHFVTGGGPTEETLHWFTIGPLSVGIGQFVDGLTAVMLTLVTLVSLCVQVYSVGYMKGDVRYTWFFAVLSLFTSAMLNVIIASDLFQLLLGWEVMGICSYLLIGHWWEERENSNAAIKAFLTTRIGDIPFMFGIFTMVFATGTSNIQEITRAAGSGRISITLLTLGALLLFGGAIGKSAQVPLHVWLPDAMAGPTPVSALIHAATMVASGVYLVGRMFSVFVHADPAVLQVVTIIGTITMLLAATLAMIQDDLKRVLAYSTVSQLAYMVASLGLGEHGYSAGLFHLYTHGFFKALLFLGAGSVIHAVHSNNMSEMGGLRKPMPVTFWTFLIGSMALSGIPPLAGFWSKDEIISTAYHQGHYVVWAVMLATAILTAFYMTRAVLLTFFGDYRGHGHPHESPATMTAPLVLLSGLSIVTGFLNATAFDLPAPFTKWVHFGPIAENEPFNYGFAAVSILGAAAGIVLGLRLYRRWRMPDPLRALGPGYVVLENKYYFDAVYQKTLVEPIRGPIARGVYWTNQHILDGVVNGAAWVTTKLAVRFRWFDERVVDGAVNDIGRGARASGGLLRGVQSGNIQTYALALFVGVLALSIGITHSWIGAVVFVGALCLAFLVVLFRSVKERA
jgi:NADH-quinone oxidoreductase subunit L